MISQSIVLTTNVTAGNHSAQDLVNEINAQIASQPIGQQIYAELLGGDRIGILLQPGYSTDTLTISGQNSVETSTLGLEGEPSGGDIQSGQRLFGGDGTDYLYAYAPTSTSAEFPLLGDELHGGSGVDFLYGNIRSQVFYAGSGDCTMYGAGVIGPTFASSPYASIIGGNNTMYGGTGDDTMYGGGGNDIMYGGAGNDYMDGQAGVNTLNGGSGIDMMVLSTDQLYSPVVVPNSATAAAQSIFNGTVASDGVLSGDAIWTEELCNGQTYSVTVHAASTASNTSLAELVVDVNAALTSAGLGGLVTARLYNGTITLQQANSIFNAGTGSGENLLMISGDNNNDTILIGQTLTHNPCWTSSFPRSRPRSTRTPD